MRWIIYYLFEQNLIKMSDKLLELKKIETIKKFSEKKTNSENKEQEKSDTIPEDILNLLKDE